MKKTYWKYIMCAALVLLSACSEEEVLSPTYTVGEADNAITLSAGISEGGSGVQTRAVDANHSKHLPFSTTNKTQLRLRVDGTWRKSSTLTDDILQCTTATTGNLTGNDNKHNELTFSPVLYWDDYGMADPENMSLKDASEVEQHSGNGRDKGLTIYGVAVNEKNLPTAETDGRASLVLDNTGSSWQNISWNVGKPSAGVIDQSAGWGDYDLLTSNNIRGDGTYKFDDFLADKKNGTTTSSNLLEFTHAMSKITFVLTAGDGFPVDNTYHKFENAPEATLTSRVTGDTSTEEWAQTKGTVNAETGVVSLTTPEKASFKMHRSGTDATTKKVTLDALIFPGSVFGNRVNSESPYPVIACIKADGNIYYITTEKIRAAITSKYGSGQELGFATQPGINYVFNITVNKTEVNVEATIKSWEDVSAEEEPIINISDAFGSTGTDFAKSFDLYRSTSVTGSYISGLTEGNHSQVTYNSSPAYTLDTPLYWPNHNTHYFFRGIWPLVNSIDNESAQLGPLSAQVKDNSVEVENAPYKEGYYPSDLMIGMPRKSDGSPDETCKISTHDKSSGDNGICATEGKIRMNFEYAMCQVIVKLETTSDPHNSVEFNQYTKVYIVDGYKEGEIKFSDGSSDFTGKTVENYEMNRQTAGQHDIFHDAVIPQSLKDNDGNATLKFRVIVGDGSQQDAYETVNGIKEINVTETGNITPHKIDEWKPGKRYTYTLTITKTGIKVVATIKDWTDVDASENIWF